MEVFQSFKSHYISVSSLTIRIRELTSSSFIFLSTSIIFGTSRSLLQWRITSWVVCPLMEKVHVSDNEMEYVLLKNQTIKNTLSPYISKHKQQATYSHTLFHETRKVGREKKMKNNQYWLNEKYELFCLFSYFFCDINKKARNFCCENVEASRMPLNDNNLF